MQELVLELCCNVGPNLSSNVGQSRVSSADNVGQSRVSSADNVGQSRVSSADNVGQSRVSSADNVGQSRVSSADNVCYISLMCQFENFSVRNDLYCEER